MRKHFALIVITAIVLLANVAFAQNYSHNNFNVNHNDQLNNCSDLKVTSEGRSVARAEQRFDIPKSEIAELQIAAARNSGIHVVSWDKEVYGVLVCKAAAADSESEAQQLVSGINVTRNGGQIATTGPESKQWIAYMIVQAPKDAALNLQVTNGPVALKGVSGKAKLDTKNGPIGLDGCTGQFTVSAHNGPIQMSGGSGTFDMKTQNGPIQVKLTSAQWQGTVTADAHNGPIQLRVPAGFKTAFLVEGSNAPLTCEAEVCKEAHSTIDEGRVSRIEYGTSPTIKLTSHNGPISVRSTSEKM